MSAPVRGRVRKAPPIDCTDFAEHVRGERVTVPGGWVAEVVQDGRITIGEVCADQPRALAACHQLLRWVSGASA